MARIPPRTLLRSLALVAALRPTPASASQCQEVPFARLVREADVVFTGRALAWDAALATTFAVERVYKGTVPARVIVESGAVKYAALAPPDRYLVLAVTDAPGTQPGNLYVHTCGGSRRLLADTDIPASLGKGTAPPASREPTTTEPTTTEPPPPTEPLPPTEPPPPTAPTAVLPTAPTEAPPATPPGGCASCSVTPSTPPPLLLLAWLASLRRRRTTPIPRRGRRWY